MSDVRTAVLLPAGGCGLRMGSDVPKQYLPILNRPLISYTIEAFEIFDIVDVVLVVIQPEQEKRMRGIIDDYHHNKVQIAFGGRTRFRSIKTGLERLNEINRNLKNVIIHDAVRPLIDEALVKEMIHTANDVGACGVTRPLVSTVLRQNMDSNIHEAVLGESLDRASHCASEMPQVFRFCDIHRAFSKLNEAELDHGTECLHVAQEYANISAKLIPGGTNLWKVTIKKDIYAIEGIIKEQQCREIQVINAESAEIDRLTKYFGPLSIKIKPFISHEESSNYNLVIIEHAQMVSTHLLHRHVDLFLEQRSRVQQTRYIGMVVLIIINFSKEIESQSPHHESQEPHRKKTKSQNTNSLRTNSKEATYVTDSRQPSCDVSDDVTDICDDTYTNCTYSDDVIRGQIAEYARSLKKKNVILNAINAQVLNDTVFKILRELLFNRNFVFSGQTFYVER